MARLRDWTNRLVGSSRVVHRMGSYRNGRCTYATWLVRCACGAEFERASWVLKEAENRGSSVLCDACIASVRSLPFKRLNVIKCGGPA